MKKLAILGAGAFGTSLAISFSKKADVFLFSAFQDHVERMNAARENEFLLGFKIPNSIQIRNTETINNNEFDCVLWTFPVAPTKTLLYSLKDMIDGTDVVICSKGLQSDGTLLSDLFKSLLPKSKIGYLSGANFAHEIASGLQTLSDITFDDINIADCFAKTFSNDTFKLIPGSDLIGVQIASAFKNIMAIASGILFGINAGQNAHAAFLTIALNEIKEIGVKLGAKENTFYGHSGLGDLILTTSSDLSRNTSIGIKLAKGEKIEDILTKSNHVCEGIETIKHAICLAKQYGMQLKVTEMLHRIIFQNADPQTIMNIF